MTAHISLREQRFRVVETRKCHEGQARASGRKKRNRARLKLLDEAEATRLGITPEQLRTRRVQATATVLEQARLKKEREWKEAQQRYDRPRYGYY